MKRSLVYLTITALVLAAIAWAQSGTHQPKGNQVMGSWELVSGTYGTQNIPGSNQREIKFISRNRFMWVLYDTSKMKTLGAGSGSYTLSGNSYTEHIDFLDVDGGEALVGKDVTFTVKVEGETLTQTGDLAGTNLKETWKRMD